MLAVPKTQFPMKHPTELTALVLARTQR